MEEEVVLWSGSIFLVEKVMVMWNGEGGLVERVDARYWVW